MAPCHLYEEIEIFHTLVTPHILPATVSYSSSDSALQIPADDRRGSAVDGHDKLSQKWSFYPLQRNILI